MSKQICRDCEKEIDTDIEQKGIYSLIDSKDHDELCDNCYNGVWDV